jgi:hypothetical protein
MAGIFICRLFSVSVPILIIWLFGGCKKLPLKLNQWIFVYFGGLIRGAIAFGLSIQINTVNHNVLKSTMQVCSLMLIVGIGSPLQLIAKILNIKPDKEIASE